MKQWLKHLHHNPITPLLESGNEAVRYFARKDLLHADVAPIQNIWNMREVDSILKKQRADGSFKPPKTQANGDANYALIETWKQFRFLVDQYRMDRTHPAVQNAAQYLLSCQSEEGDIRGILCNQYAPYYTGAILYLLIKAGYADDPRIDKGIRWLLTMRQSDGGWVIGSPGLINRPWKEVVDATGRWTDEPWRDFDWQKPFSAAGTGMAIRALAVHPRYCTSKQARTAAALLCSKFFKEDNYSSYRHKDNWVRFQFPYWWNHLVSALDMATSIGLTDKNNESVRTAIDWLIQNQQPNGMWKASYSSIHKQSNNKKSHAVSLWISLAICNIFKRLYA